ncbi:hypothetical protein BK125_04775 [Paenibacillus odorifer]|uniref:Uncharacterized protein n=1 Tax=Paenibacillus odorifer TaxID=189426 RepID=A0ABX3GQP6_9BACL|nr:hypothetical protein [Paenibacillus odorifer]OMC79597.1 hypothetical protein BK125_04775 [Paenibacillus odorifer]OMD34943.1 hypothetical protein BSO21_10020 [Paenibacillus odorifer]
MQISEIISEADLLVPNQLTTAEKVMFLNNIEHDFFNVVKIPLILYFSTSKDQSTYVINNIVRAKNIDIVHVGVIKYKELLPNTPNPLQNTYVFDDYSSSIVLNPAPYQEGLKGFLRYFYIAVNTFSALDLNVVPEAPPEYHWTYSLGLASYIANAMDDMNKGSFYEAQYLKVWDTAARQYAGVETNG